MNLRVITGVVGALTVLLGIGALISPEFVMQRVVGFAVDPSFSTNFVRGEVRAVYGGLFTVLGILTLLSAMDLAMHRSRVFLIGLLWLGAAGGRLVGVAVDGNPGLVGWFSVVFEIAVGGGLVLISQLTPPSGTSGF